MLRTRKALLLAACVCLAATVARAETLEEILTQVEEKARTVQDMSGELEMNMDVMGQKVSANGSFMMVPLSGKFVMDMKMTMLKMEVKMKMVSNGTLLFQEMQVGDRKMVNRVDVKKVPGLNVGSMMGGPGMGGLNSIGSKDYAKGIAEMQKLMQMEVKDEATLTDGQKAWVLEGKFTPKYYRMMEAQGQAPGASAEILKSKMAGVRLYIGKNDKFMNKMEFLSSDDKQTGSMEFKNLKFNQGLDERPELFVYRVPEGTQVNDMTGMMQKKMAAIETIGETSGAPGKTPKKEVGPVQLLKPGINAAVFVTDAVDGTRIDLTKLRGKPVVIYFWATWHKGTVKQLTELNRIKGAWAGKVHFMALSLDETDREKQVKQLLIGNTISVPVALGTNKIFDAYAVREIPCYVVIGPEGKVLFSEARQKNLVMLRKTLEAIGNQTDDAGDSKAAKPVDKAAAEE